MLGPYGELDCGNVRADGLQEVAKQVLKRAAAKQTTLIDRIYSLDMFKKEFGYVMGTENGLSDSDFQVLLTFMRRDKEAISYDGKVRLSLCVENQAG